MQRMQLEGGFRKEGFRNKGFLLGTLRQPTRAIVAQHAAAAVCVLAALLMAVCTDWIAVSLKVGLLVFGFFHATAQRRAIRAGLVDGEHAAQRPGRAPFLGRCGGEALVLEALAAALTAVGARRFVVQALLAGAGVGRQHEHGTEEECASPALPGPRA